MHFSLSQLVDYTSIDKIMTVLAFVFSFVSIVIAIWETNRSVFRFEISTTLMTNYSFDFSSNGQHHFIFIYLFVENVSNSAATIPYILLNDGKSDYRAKGPSLSNSIGRDYLDARNTKSSNKGLRFPITNDNILLNPRVQSYDFAEGYAIFDIGRSVEIPEKMKITVHVGGKDFSSIAFVKPLPEHYTFEH